MVTILDSFLHSCPLVTLSSLPHHERVKSIFLPLNLSCACDLLWPTECDRSDEVPVPNPRLALGTLPRCHINKPKLDCWTRSFSSSHVRMWQSAHGKGLSAEELMLLNCGVGKLLRVSWTAGRPNQWILKEINPEYSLEGLMLKLGLQYFGHLMGRAGLFGKDPDSK